MTIALIAIFCTGTIFMVAFALFGDRIEVSRRVAELESSAQLASPERHSGLFARLLGSVDRDAVEEKLVEAGWYDVSVPAFMTWRVISAFAVAGAIVFLLAMSHVAVFGAYFGLGSLGLAGFIIPSFVLDHAIGRRKIAIGNRLPDLLDMVATTVEAGTSLNAALATARLSIDGPLAEELDIALSDIRMGRNRVDAFNAMAVRAKHVDLTALVNAIVQTEKLGGKIGTVLDELSQEARSRRLMRAEEIAAQLPVKMVIPMAVFMLPALFVMIFTPVIADLLTNK